MISSFITNIRNNNKDYAIVDNIIKSFNAQLQTGNKINLDDLYQGLDIPSEFKNNYGKFFKQYANGLNNACDAGKKVVANTVDLNKVLAKQGKQLPQNTSMFTKFSSGIKTVGKILGSTALNIGTNLLISKGLDLAGEAWVNYSNKQENAIQKGNEFLNRFKETQQALQQSAKWIDNNAERYSKLSQGVTFTGENKNLTQAEYEEYNQLSAQLAQYLPDQVTGYNQLGTAILGSTKSVKELNAALNAQKLKENSELVKDSTDAIAKFNAEMYQDKTDWTKESGLTNQLDAINQLTELYKKVNGDKKELLNQLSKSGASKYQADGSINPEYDGLAGNPNFEEALKNAGIKGTGFFGSYTLDDYVDNYQSILEYGNQIQQQIESSADTIKEVMPAFLNSQKDYQKVLEQTPAIDSMVQSTINNLTANDLSVLGFIGDGISSEETSKKIREWSVDLVTDLKDSGLRESYNNLFALDSDKAEMSFKEYQDTANKTINDITKRSDAFTEQQLKNSSGVSDSLTEMSDAYKNVSDRFHADPGFSHTYVLNEMQSSDLLTLASIARDATFTGDYQEALANIANIQRAEELSLSSMQEKVTSAQTALSNFSSAISESQSATGLTADSISTLKEQFQRLTEEGQAFEGMDLNSLFKNTADGVKLNSDAMQGLVEAQHKADSQNFADSIKYQKDEISKQKDELSKLTKGTDEYIVAQEKLKQLQSDLSGIQQAQSQYQALYNQQKELFTNYAEWQQAQSTENAGDKYTSMVSGLKSAKELFDKGLVGTDDFKSFAKLISPTGATDAENFAENYGKATRYLTETDKGVKNFLNDLDSKGLAEFNAETQQWSYNIKDMAEAAQQMGISEEFMSAMFGRLEDYGFHNNFISDAQEGVLKLTDTYGKLYEAEKDLQNLEKNDSGNTTAISAKREEIESYKRDIEELKQNLSTIGQQTSEDYNNEVESAKQVAEAMARERQRILEENTYGTNTQSVADKMEDDINQLEEMYHFTLTPELNTSSISSEIENMSENQTIIFEAELNDGSLAKIEATKDEKGQITYTANVDGVQYAISSVVENEDGTITYTANIDGVETELNSVKNKDGTVTYTINEIQGETIEKPEDDVKTITVNEEQGKTVDSSQDGVKNLTVNETLGETVNTVPDATGTANFTLGDSPEEVPDASGIANFDLGTSPLTVPDATGVANFTLGTYPTSVPAATQIVNQIPGLKLASGTMTSIAHADGTMHNAPWNYQNLSTAYANGKVSLPKDEKALVNEVGQESIIRNGVWSLIPGKMHVENLKKGDIILNAKQTTELLKFGKTNSHARAYAEGTIPYEHFISNSYASGSGYGSFKGGASYTGNPLSNSKAQNDNTSTTNDNTTSKQKNTAAVKKSTKAFDWVERRLKYFADKTKAIADTITDYVTSAFKTAQLTKQMKSIDSEIYVNQKAYDAYMKKANSVALSAKYKKLVQEGHYYIGEGYSETVADAIDKYQEYYDKAMECKQAITELKNEQLELFEQWANMPTEAAEKKIESYERRLRSITAAYDTVSTGGSSVAKYAAQIKSSSGKNAMDKAVAEKNTAKTNLDKAKAAKKVADSNVKTADKAVSTTASTLKSAAKKKSNKVSSSTQTAINNAIKNGKKVSTKGLSGDVLKAAKAYNASLDNQSKAEKAQSDAQKKVTKAQTTYNTAKKNATKATDNYNYNYKNALTSAQRAALKYANDVTYKGQNALLDAQLAETKNENTARQSALTQATKNLKTWSAERTSAINARDKAKKQLTSSVYANNNLTKAQKEALKNNQVISTAGIKNANLLNWVKTYNAAVQKLTTTQQKYNIALNAQQEAAANAAEAQAEYAKMLVENEQQKFENIQNYYNAQIDYQKALEDSYSTDRERKEAYGKDTTESDFQKQIDAINKQKASMTEEKKKLETQFNNSVKKGIIKANSEEWYKMKADILALGDEIDNLDMSVLELQDTMREEVFYRAFEKALEKADSLRSTLSDINRLITDEMKYDDNGKLTDFGLTALAMDVKNYESYLGSIQTLLDKRAEYIKQYNGGNNSTNYSQKEFDDDMQKITEDIRSLMSNADDARRSVISAVTSQAKAELDAINKVIDAEKERWKKRKEYNDYDKTLRDKTKEIQLLKQQSAALEGVNILPYILFNSGDTPITLIRYNGTGNGKRECGTSL